MARSGSKTHKKSAAAAHTSVAHTSAKKKKKETDPKKKLFAVGVVVFGVLMALGMMLPSLAPIFSHQEQERAQADAQKEVNDKKDSKDSSDSSNDDSSDENANDNSDKSNNKKDPQKVLQGFVDRYQEKLKSDPKDLAALLNLGNTYLALGQSKIEATSDKILSQDAIDPLVNAVTTYDKYLEINDSDAVRSNRAMALHFMGQEDKARESLKAVVERNDSFAPAYVDLGIIEAAAGNNDAALEYYQQALNADPDDQYGEKSMVNARITMLTALKSKKDAAGDNNN